MSGHREEQTGGSVNEPRTWLEEIPVRRCIALLDGSWLGRIALDVGGHPEIFPVNHVVDRSDGSILFPTRVGTKLRAALDAPLVAFEVDGVDPIDGSGWSVLVVGAAEVERDPDVAAWATSWRAVPWAVSDASTWIRIRPVRVTGRRISLVA
ncbi:MAG: pyridoxamine 5'-phosphate oxidase family protein [Microbacteriaceae bacterium]